MQPPPPPVRCPNCNAEPHWTEPRPHYIDVDTPRRPRPAALIGRARTGGHDLAKRKPRHEPQRRGKHPVSRGPVPALSLPPAVQPDAGGLPAPGPRPGGPARYRDRCLSPDQDPLRRHATQTRDHSELDAPPRRALP